MRTLNLMRIKFLLMLWEFCRWARHKNFYPKGAIALQADKDTGYVYFRDKTAFIIIDGSSNLREWLENILIWKHGKYKAAYGFDNVATEMLKQIVEALKDWRGNIVVAGHSRGGAVSPLLALNLLDLGFKKVDCYSFGQPMVGGLRFYLACKLRSLSLTRVAIEGDPVVNLPPKKKRSGRWVHYQSELITLPDPKLSARDTHLSYGDALAQLLVSNTTGI